MTGFEEIEILRRELEESKRIIEVLEYDELTGLLIRQAFLQRAERIIKDNPSKLYGILALDFENFKSANTLYGEEKCNDFLRYIGKELRTYLPNNLIGRFGGDQFVILFDAQKNYMDLLEAYKLSILKDAPIPNQIVKFGIYAPVDRNLLLVRCCDRAFLSITKIKGVYGQNISFYEDSMQQQILDEQKIVESMESALAEGQFMVYYQPKHEAVTDKIAGAEALVRWQHPVYGFMNPGKFIPLFERNGFITKLDSFIVEKVCRDINRWKDQGLPVVPISVNISRRDFLEPGCIENQLAKIEEYKIEHNLIHIEVTESMYSDDTNLIVSKVRNTQERGFLIEMDDFGAGYSSLGSLSTFPLDVLKLDISFVRNIDINKVIIENIIKMAHRMGLHVVAEGVESEVQYKILKGLGCDLIQGYYFSKPIPLGEFESYLRHHSTTIVHKNGKDTLLMMGDHNEEQMLMLATEVSEGIPGGFLSCHSDENLEVISINRELLSIYECDTAEEIRQFYKNSARAMVHAEDFDEVFAQIKNQLTDENSIYASEHRIITRTGKTKYVKDYGRLVKTKRYGDIFFVFIYDVTQEKLREQQVEKERSEKLELENSVEIAKRANVSKSIFMRNLLNDVIPLVREIVDGTKTVKQNLDNTECIKNVINEQDKTEEKLLAYINNLKEVSKQEVGNVELKEVASDISLAPERIYNIFHKEAEKKNIKLEYWSKIYNPYIYQDIIHTTDVVFNILRNAVKYTPEGGCIKFGLEQEPSANPNECNIKFICEDSGIGISQDFMPYIFEPFIREENEVNEAIPSAGLGLNIAYNLLKLMRGTISVYSVKGKCTKVVTTQPHRFAKQEDVAEESAHLTSSIKD